MEETAVESGTSLTAPTGLPLFISQFVHAPPIFFSQYIIFMGIYLRLLPNQFSTEQCFEVYRI